MLRKKLAVLVLLAAATAVPSAAAPAFADGPKNAQEAAVCKQLLGSVVPGLVPTSSLCTVNHDSHGTADQDVSDVSDVSELFGG